MNQHQALKLAPLHSMLYPVVKEKLYSYIHVYNDVLRQSELYMGPLETAFKVQKDLNNPKTNRFTIVSLGNIDLC